MAVVLFTSDGLMYLLEGFSWAEGTVELVLESLEFEIYKQAPIIVS